MSHEDAARVLERSLRRFHGSLTVADAAARSGLPTREASEGLARLAADYSGHLAVTEKGELIYEFPRGLVRSDRPGLLRRMGRAIGKAVAGVARFVVRAWVSVALIGYAVLFGVVLIAAAAKTDSDSGLGEVAAGLGRLLIEALYWTFHPFTVFQGALTPGHDAQARGRKRKRIAGVPFYERVNRFVFGPPRPAKDPRGDASKLLAEIRRQHGRVVPADVMRVTGGGREAAERTLLQLVADHDGEITVSDEGAILYEFPALRITADAAAVRPAIPIWQQLAKPLPLTGNDTGTNVVVTIVNGFNLAMGAAGVANDWTIRRLVEIAARVGVENPAPLPPPDGAPLVLGWLPLAFSAMLFALPLLRAYARKSEERFVRDDNRVRLLLRRLLAGDEAGWRFRFSPAELAEACAVDGVRPGEAEVERAVRALGGSVDLDDQGRLTYTFEDLAREHAAARRSRASAPAEEARPGRILLSSADEGHGLRDGSQ